MGRKQLEEILKDRILILDGGMGTMLQRFALTAHDFGGADLEGCNEILNITRPDIVTAIHEAYLEAGADIIETNTFGATSIVLAEYYQQDRDIELNKTAAGLARKAADRFTTDDKPRFVAGSMGPTTKMLSLSKDVQFDDFVAAYYRQALGLLEGGVDLLLIETSQDTLNVKAAGIGIQNALQTLAKEVPVMLSCTIEPSGTMLAGQNIEAFYISVAHLKPIAVGLNCGSGAELMTDHIRTLSAIASCAVSCYPNAGLPDEEGQYQESPAEFARKLAGLAQQGWLNIAGGCCGTTAEHIKALALALQPCEPRAIRAQESSCIAGIEAVWPEDENRPLIVGERTNVIGSRLFKEMLVAGRLEEGAEIARAQTKKGAQVIDVCVANPDRNELRDMQQFLPYVVSRVKAPIMLDSTDPAVIEAGLKLTPGKSIVNSINLENGLERYEDTIPLIRKYGAAVVVGLIDEHGMAVSRERKLEVALRSYDLLVNHYGLAAADIIFDPLTFPVGTGDLKYLGSAVETIEGLRLIKQRLPQCKTILGISNVSFGLPAAGREVLNAVFVYHNTLAGLDYAIVNAEKLRRYATIPQEERDLAQELLLNTDEAVLKKFTDFYREKKSSEIRPGVSDLSVEERLAANIVEGSKDGLEQAVAEAIRKYQPLEIINGPLLKGMEEVGRLFNENKLIVAEVLQSAEVMKAAVTLLEPYMERTDGALKGRIVLATVKGDVHDIGKNLVDIILSNNGYTVINLGVKVSPEQLIEACRIHKPDVIGLSGLLVKSVQQMLVTARDLRAAYINIPLILGGAALTRKYTDEKIAPEYEGTVIYAKDAMDSLSLLNQLMNKTTAKPDIANSAEQKSNMAKPEANSEAGEAAGGEATDGKPVPVVTGPAAPVYEYHRPKPSELTRRIVRDVPLDEIMPYLNIDKFIGRYLGLALSLPKSTDQEIKAVTQYRGTAKTNELYKRVMEFIEQMKRERLITANGVYAFYPAYANGNTVTLLDPENHQSILAEFNFPRQETQDGLCLADFIGPKAGSATEAELDYIGLFALTTGVDVNAKAAHLRREGEYLQSYVLQAFALELAEAFAEKIHAQMRKVWGIDADEVQAMRPNNPGKYCGIRVSPGYPVFPDLEDQTKIFKLLKPEEVGMTLTEGMMMEPEASVTALVLSHPQARFFPLQAVK